MCAYNMQRVFNLASFKDLPGVVEQNARYHPYNSQTPQRDVYRNTRVGHDSRDKRSTESWVVDASIWNIRIPLSFKLSKPNLYPLKRKLGKESDDHGEQWVEHECFNNMIMPLLAGYDLLPELILVDRKRSQGERDAPHSEQQVAEEQIEDSLAWRLMLL